MNLPFTVGLSPTLGFRGIIATEDIPANTIVERCPLLFIPTADEESLKKTILWKYYYEWTKKLYCIVLGYGSLVNHSYTPSAKYIFDYRRKSLLFKTIKAIKKGEEITVNYNCDPENKEALPEMLLDNNKHVVSQESITFVQEKGISLPFVIGESPTLGIRGLLATRRIPKGEIFEYCPVVLFPVEQEEFMNKTVLGNYYFEWDKTHCAFAFGYGGLINHKQQPNVYFSLSAPHLAVIFQALEDIAPGEELFINYNGYEADKDKPVDLGYIDFDHHQKKFR